MKIDTEDVVIVGAGIIGLACGYRLLQEGRSVLWVDPKSPGSGASYGNAGTIADYAVMPVGSPSVLKRLPQLLFDSESPLSMQPGALAMLAPWLAKFAYQSLPGPMAKNMRAIAALVLDAASRWQELARAIAVEDHFKNEGCLYVYRDAAALRRGKHEMALRAEAGVDVVFLTPTELSELEPQWPAVDGGAAFFPKSLFVTDPGDLANKLANAGANIGGRFLTESVKDLSNERESVVMTLTNGRRIRAHKVVISAGAYSKGLAAKAGDKTPLITERGYHLEFEGQANRVQRPICVADQGFYMTPMAGRLRVAGTVELGGVDSKPSPHRLSGLIQQAQAVFPDLGSPQRTWLGFRPSLPDSRPILSPSSQSDRIVYAYGHGHIGLTLAPISAEIVAALIGGRSPPCDISAYSVQRFSQWRG